MALSTWLTLKRLRLSNQIELIDSHFAFPEGFAANRLSKILNIPYVVTLRGARDTDTIGTSREQMLKTAIIDAHAIIGVSDSLRKFAINVGALPIRARAITNGVDTKVFFPEDRLIARSRLNIEANIPVLISVGSLIPLKGHHRVVELLPALKVKFPTIKLLIVGGSTGFGDTTALIRDLAKQLDVEDNVVLCGRISPNEIRWYLSAANLFTLATENEGWPNALMEALACGIPIVTTNVGGNSEIVSNKLFGEVVEYWEPIKFTNAIIERLNSDTGSYERTRFGENSSWEETGKKVVEVWDDVLASYHDTQQ